MDQRLAALDRSLLLLRELVCAEPQAIAEHLAASRVQIVASDDAATDGSAQAAIATLASLLARTGLGIEASLPRVPVATRLLAGSDLQTAVAILVAESFPGAQLHQASADPDLVILIGGLPPVPGHRSLWLLADDRQAGFRSIPARWRPANPLVALGASGMAASEAIRHVLRGLAPLSRSAAAELAPIESAEVTIPLIPSGLIRLGSWDCISAGAITNSMLWTFMARDQVKGDIRVFDDGQYDATNLNRYVLLTVRVALAETSKAEHLCQIPLLPGLRMTPVPRRFSIADVETARRQIMIGADDIRVRHIAQRSDPEYLAIGATSHFEARLTQHFPDGPCAGCAHPYYNELDDGLIPTLAPVSFWAGFQLALFVLAKASGEPIPADQSYATYWPLRPGSGIAGPVLYHPRCKLGHGQKDDAA